MQAPSQLICKRGKVEIFARFVKENFYYPLKSKLRNAQVKITPELLNNYGSSWLENINARIHGTLGKRPVDLFNEEKRHLLPVTEYKFSRNYIYRHQRTAGERVSLANP